MKDYAPDPNIPLHKQTLLGVSTPIPKSKRKFGHFDPDNPPKGFNYRFPDSDGIVQALKAKANSPTN